jgi:hypothetical protein
MTELLPWLLLIHVGGAIIGFGPTFAVPRIAALGARNPEHAIFATRLVLAITRGITIPLAVVVFLSGAAMIPILRIDLLGARWLLVAIALFVAAFGYALFVQSRDLARIIELGAAALGLTEAARAELAARRLRVRRGGLFLRVALLAIIVLMVVKPAF